MEANFTYEDYNGDQRYKEQRVQILLGRFGISYSRKFSSSILLEANDRNISELAEYLLNDKGLSHLFHDKYAIEILATEERFCNLNLYLQECFEFIKSDRKISNDSQTECEIILSVISCL